jgi:hypothetical protein
VGYLGPTSFVGGLEDDSDLISNSDQLTQNGGEGLAISPTSWWVKRAIEVFRSLEDFATIKRLIQEYYAVTQTAVIASPVVLSAIEEIEITFRESLSGTATNQELTAFSTCIIQNTSNTFRIPPNITGATFHKCFTGSSLRLEIIGIICALAGRASYFGLSGSKVSNAESLSQLSRKMLAACDMTLHICKDLTALNELTLWLVHENLVLSSLVLGDSSASPFSIPLAWWSPLTKLILGSVTWQRLGELSTNIFELGVHRDNASSTPLPRFILESRRRLFAAAYQLDKNIATFLGRPPRISWRHSDCCLPLDIGDHVLAGDPELLETAQTSLDADGWNIEKIYQRATWIRLRFIISTFREEILELSFQKPSAERTNQLMQVHFYIRTKNSFVPPY